MRKNQITLKKQIASRFKEFRLKHGWTQCELSKIIEIDQSSISNIEGMKCLPTILTISIMMEKFQLSPTWLLSGIGTMTVNYPIINCSPSDQSEIDDLIFHLENVPPVREYILKEFIVYRFRNQEKIKKLLDNMGNKRACKH